MNCKSVAGGFLGGQQARPGLLPPGRVVPLHCARNHTRRTAPSAWSALLQSELRILHAIHLMPFRTPAHRLFVFLIAVATLISLAASSAVAAESEIVGKSKAGRSFSFQVGGASPDPSRLADFPLPPNISVAPDSPNDVIGMLANAAPTARAPEIFNNSQCIMLFAKDTRFISCAAQPKNALSGVVYQYKGENKAGDGMYSCVIGCSNRVPRTLLETAIDPGC